MGPGGKHARMGTHNLLSGLGPAEYFEVIATDPEAPPLDRPRWFDLDRRAGPPRIGNWIVRTDDLDALVATYPQAGRPLTFERGAFRWRMAVPDNGILPYDGCFPALIQWDSAPPSFPDIGARLTGFAIRHPEATELGPLLASLIDDPRLSVTQGPRRIAATLDTPDGARVLA